MLSLDLEKSAQTLRLSLKKVGVAEPPEAEVAFLLDVSGSFEGDHTSGETNRLLSRLVPWSMVFDPDRKIDVFTFSDGAYYVGEANDQNYANYIRNRVVEKVPGWNGGTNFSPVLTKAIEHMGWAKETALKKNNLNSKPRGWLGRWFDKIFGRYGAPEECLTAPSGTSGKTALLAQVTDGENYDTGDTREVLRNAMREGYRIFFLFVGIERSGREFRFLTDIDREFDNVGFVRVSDIGSFVRLSDEEINQRFLVPKLIDWLKAE